MKLNSVNTTASTLISKLSRTYAFPLKVPDKGDLGGLKLQNLPSRAKFA